MTKKSWVLFVIVISQFACTSLWFAGNAVLPDIQKVFHLSESTIGHITSAVQFGFISGTLTFAFFTISDRHSPSKVFFICAIVGALTNISILFLAKGLGSIMVLRILTGFMLAGIYPVGMKIASDYHQQGLGKALGFLVGALVVGTALPHLLKTFTRSLPWESVIIGTSGCAIAGGLLILTFVPDGPYRRMNSRPDLRAFYQVFRRKDFRSAAFGYFGHMWELYTFWAFVPVLITTYNRVNSGSVIFVPLLSFLVIAIGGPGCVLGGYLSQRFGSAKVAFIALLSSGVCCLISPFLFQLPLILFLSILLFWGMTVVTDSPQFSTLVSQTVPTETIGTAFTIVNCIGFSITIVSIQLINTLAGFVDLKYIYLLLAVGPIFGLKAMYDLIVHRL